MDSTEFHPQDCRNMAQKSKLAFMDLLTLEFYVCLMNFFAMLTQKGFSSQRQNETNEYMG